MKITLFLVLTFVVHAVFAQLQPGSTVAKVVVQNGKKNEVALVAVQPGKTYKLNELKELRKELNALAKKAEYQRMSAKQKVKHDAKNPQSKSAYTDNTYQDLFPADSGPTRDSVFMETTKRFGPETLTFFIAVGAVTFNTMWIKTAGDPLAMERHILSLKDPLAHISFFAFMQANGHYSDFARRKAGLDQMDRITQKNVLRAISYKGLAVGSLASSIVNDVGSTIQQCANALLNGKTDDQSLEVCDEALSIWGPRKIFGRYFPQIIALWGSQAVTELLETGLIVHGGKAARTAALAGLIRSQDSAFTIKAVDVVLAFTPGKIATKGFKFLGAVTKIGAFVAVDHVISPLINRPLNSIIKPIFGSYDIQKLNNTWQKTEASGFHFADNDYDNNRFEDSIEEYSKAMQDWRNHLTENLEQDYLGWNEMTKKLLNQADYSYKFYNQFVTSLAEQMTIRNQVGRGLLEKSALDQISNYPQRNLPFFGLKPGPYKTSGDQKLEDLYLTNPMELSFRQKENVLNVAKKYSTSLFKDMKQDEVAQFLKIIKLLSTGNDAQMAQGLSLFKTLSDDVYKASLPVHVNTTQKVSSEAPRTVFYSKQLTELMSGMRSELGSPNPIMYPLSGFSWAIHSNSVFQKANEVSQFSLFSVKHGYKFDKTSDLMMYNIICGADQGYLNKNEMVIEWTSAEFRPPTLLKQDSARKTFCSTPTSSGQLGENFYSGQINHQPLATYVMKNFNYGLLSSTNEGFTTAAFDQWWMKNVSKNMNTEMATYDSKYQTIVKQYVQVLNNIKGRYHNVTDKINLNKGQYSPDYAKNLQKEMNVYLQIINRATGRSLDQLRATPELSASEEMWKKLVSFNRDFWTQISGGIYSPSHHDYVSQVENVYQSPQFKSIYGKTLTRYTQGQTFSLSEYLKKLENKAPIQENNTNVEQIHIQLNKYLAEVKKGKINKDNFDQMILISKQVDTLINEILVEVGLKTKAQKAATSTADIFSMEDESTEVSQIQYSDVKVTRMTTAQRSVVAAIKGLRSVENELKKFARMQVALGYAIAIEEAEIKALMQ